MIYPAKKLPRFARVKESLRDELLLGFALLMVCWNASHESFVSRCARSGWRIGNQEIPYRGGGVSPHLRLGPGRLI